MRARTVAALAALAVVAGCSSKGSDEAANGGEDRIACAIGGAKELHKDCSVERSQLGDKLSLIVRHPDGGFRRFDVVTDGRGLVLADGAEQARTHLEGDALAVSVGQDRYVFPAKVKPADAAAPR